MIKSNITVTLQSNKHANLDSFPFRYGFFTETDIKIELTKVRTIDKRYIYLPDERYGVSATFKLPNAQKPLMGKFIISKRDDCIVTVIREGSIFKTEHYLSETLKTLREAGDIDTPDDLIEMYKAKIKTHPAVITFLSNKIGEKKVIKAERITRERIDKLAASLGTLKAEVDKKNDEIDHLTNIAIVAEFGKEEALEEVDSLKQELEKSTKKNIALELSMNNSIQYEEVRMSNNDSFSDIDWSKEGSTSGVFKCSEVCPPYLVVILHTDDNDGVREIKCKNTHGNDYIQAIEDVKNLKDGDPIMYSTRGSNNFGSGWFYKIELDNL